MSSDDQNDALRERFKKLLQGEGGGEGGLRKMLAARKQQGGAGLGGALGGGGGEGGGMDRERLLKALRARQGKAIAGGTDTLDDRRERLRRFIASLQKD